ncbi:hypothetical protein [Aquabacterium sp.]|uniref:hypothetical protein n=1 Tax=Aquabacterium sp. TaxID=1872578 RepID=UPI0019AF55BB|nr:hypothetical protein [Aquabacterium sp.]MBC7701681.1 hypothetical protein [Aquabacterium sp.]
MTSAWRPWAMALTLTSCSCCCALAADGAALDLGTRDPTQMPATLQQALRPDMADRSAGETLPQPFFIMSHGGKLTVIHKAHRLHVGDELDNARIVRIDNDAVWLRESGQVKKVAIYPDVMKRPTAPTASSHQRHRRSPAAKKDAP